MNGRIIRIAPCLYFQTYEIGTKETESFCKGFNWGSDNNKIKSSANRIAWERGRQLRLDFESGEYIYRVGDMMLIPKFAADSPFDKVLPLHHWARANREDPFKGKPNLRNQYFEDYNRSQTIEVHEHVEDKATLSPPRYGWSTEYRTSGQSLGVYWYGEKFAYVLKDSIFPRFRADHSRAMPLEQYRKDILGK